MVKLIPFVAFCILGAALVKAEFNKEEAIKEFMQRAGECSTEVGASPSDLDELMKDKSASTKEGKCLRACVMKRYNVMTEDGKFSREGALQKAELFTEGDPEKMKVAGEIVDECLTAGTSSDHCEAAAEYCTCFKTQLAKRGIKME